MPLDKLTDDLDIIAKLPDEPNDVGGLSAAELKAKFDEAGNLIKTFLNDILILALDNNLEDLVKKDKELQAAIDNIVSGSLPDRSVTSKKLAPQAVDHAALGLNAVESANIKNGAVGNLELGANAVSTEKVADGAITNSKLGRNAVDQNAMGLNAVWENNIKDGAVTGGKLADGAVSARSIGTQAVETANIADDAVSKSYTARLTVSGWSGGKVQSVTVTGLKAASKVTVDIDCTGKSGEGLEALNDAWGGVLKAEASNGSITVTMRETPSVDIPLKIKEELK